MGPDKNGRIDGTTYPRDVAPPGCEDLDVGVRLRDRIKRIVRAGFALVRSQPGDVLIVRSDSLTREDMGEINRNLRAGGFKGVAIRLPRDSVVHAEPSKLKGEDRGYRETKTYGTDRPEDKSNVDSRGVRTGLPENLTPHPLSEGAGDDPCAS